VAGGRVPLAAVLSAALGGLAAGSTLLLLGLTVLGVVDLGEPLGSPLAAASQAAGWQAVDVLPSLDGLGDDRAAGQAAAGPLPAGSTGAGLLVDVAGAVVRPGLQRVAAGARVADAIEAAGGYGPRVDLAATARTLNLAQPLVDGSKVVVPELGLSNAPAGQPGDDRIDLNSADQATLESLPGIGPVTAARILAARTERPFGAVSELRDRGIVGESVYADIAELVRTGGV
jgi:competence protein ComEA